MDPRIGGAAPQRDEAGSPVATRRLAWWGCAAAGAAAAALAWIAVGLVGPLAVRTVGAAALVAIAGELCWRRPARALVVGLVVALAAAPALLPGAGSPLFAWPLAGLASGGAAAFVSPRAWARVLLVVLTPLLGSCAFVLGAVLVAATGFTADDARVLDQVLLGGAVGFGAFVGAFVPSIASARIGRGEAAAVAV